MFEKQIAAGMAWLDASYPNWISTINLSSLSLVSPCRCILGQQFGEFGACPKRREFNDRGWIDWAIDHGFVCEGDDWDFLTAEWIAAIRQRQAKAEPARATRPAAGMALTAICLR